MRLTGGALRGRKLAVPPGLAVRPTAERVREALFNRLAHGGFGADGGSILAGARVLDLCCGTGALAFEALSRGAAHATLVDAAPASLRLARDNARVLGVAERCTFLASHLPVGLPAGPFDLVFFDPPYASDLYEPVLQALARSGSVRTGGLVSVEAPAKRAIAVPEGFTLRHDQRYGATRLWLLQADEAG
ncbi:MAG: 16S rRNA (guanine(966)-N(2))-methyltransferase RsmD [Alphaproteobacteria bacterium]|nr:16S rRNA (guanine(966)-N(2))-methyltransferase RsmD [Alphaproteobacteria bacterium]MCB9930220.1 16S rRNA (guanine(966)-N(2))-methyltransferase RsmD [Alphaproteobacteria bacterium]